MPTRPTEATCKQVELANKLYMCGTTVPIAVVDSDTYLRCASSDESRKIIVESAKSKIIVTRVMKVNPFTPPLPRGSSSTNSNGEISGNKFT